MSKNTKKYALRLGFGREGHGHPIVVAEGRNNDECDARARGKLQEQFGGLWQSKLADTFIGSAEWLDENFPWQPGTPSVREVLARHEGEAQTRNREEE